MFSAVLGAMIATVGTWAVLGLIFTGIGLSLRRAFGLRLHSADDGLAAFWLGWSGVIAALQVWHLALPVDGRAAALAAALGAAGLIWNRRAILDDLRSRIGQRRTWAALAGLLLAAVLLSNRAIGAPAIHDTGLYHIPTVHWIETYPIVPGLGNLHDRLAFNNSSLLYAALLDQGFWDGRAQHLAGGLLLLALTSCAARTIASPRRNTWQAGCFCWRCSRRGSSAWGGCCAATLRTALPIVSAP